MGSLTDEQLKILNDDIEDGLVMIVEKKHYYQQAERVEELEESLEDVRARVFEIKYHQTKPKASRHDKTIRICVDIESRIKLALKGGKEGSE